eukprot:3779404-Amphidinium_carterae.1
MQWSSQAAAEMPLRTPSPHGNSPRLLVARAGEKYTPHPRFVCSSSKASLPTYISDSSPLQSHNNLPMDTALIWIAAVVAIGIFVTWPWSWGMGVGKPLLLKYVSRRPAHRMLLSYDAILHSSRLQFEPDAGSQNDYMSTHFRRNFPYR